MPLDIQHHHYNHQIKDPANYPGVGPYKVFDGEKLVAVVREVHPEIGLSEEAGIDLRCDCHSADGELQSKLDEYFAGRKVGYFPHGEEWSWRDNVTYEAMPWSGKTSILALRGIVDGGQRYMREWYADNPLLSKALGVQLHPGTINVFVSTTGRPELSSSAHPFFRPERDEGVDPGNILAQGFFYVRDCKLNGHAAFILRTEYPGKAYDGPGKVVATRLPQPNVMFEVVAPRIPGLAYGAEVSLMFDADPTKLRTVRVR